MIKGRKRVNGEAADDLADVNEQELAKDIDADGRDSETEVGEQERDGVIEQVGGGEATEEQSVEETRSHDENGVVPVEETRDGARTQDKGERADGTEDVDEAKPRKVKRSARVAAYVAVMITCLLLAIAMVVGALMIDGEKRQITVIDDTSESEQPSPVTEAPSPVGERLGAEEIYAGGVRSAVTVTSTANGGVQYFSGFAVFDGGYVATLCEAVDGTSSVEIVTHEGRTFPATVVGADRTVNLALLKADAAPLEKVSVGDADTLSVGSGVFAIGSVGGGKYASSLIATQVAHCERSPLLECCDGVTRRVTAIQLGSLDDEALKGCPIFNCYGEAVAIALASVENGVASLAIPLDRAMEVLLQMKDGGALSEDVLHSLAYEPPRLGIIGEQAQLDEIWGVRIIDFAELSSDCASKLRIGDLIWKIGDEAVSDAESLKTQIELYRAGDTVEVFVRRNSQALSFFVTVN